MLISEGGVDWRPPALAGRERERWRGKMSASKAASQVSDLSSELLCVCVCVCVCVCESREKECGVDEAGVERVHLDEERPTGKKNHK